MARISLCMIVGNVEEYIERCLKSFLPMCDEVCMVRAIGCLEPDRTFELAHKTCTDFWGGPTGPTGQGFVFAEYKNAPGHEDWPHLDSFGAARNLSFELATGDYCFWCDSDDILESGAELIREHAERGGYPAYTFPYKIFGRGITVMRDRMIVRGAAKWKFPVHETFEFKMPPTTIQDERVVITHLPNIDKCGSNSRNLTILAATPESEMTTGMLYHYHVELCIAGQVPESVAIAKRCLAQPDLGRPEKYEIFMNLAQATEEPAEKAALLHQAYAVNPTKREALGLLANNSLNFGMPEDGLAYARQMMATTQPKELAWTDREPIYGWVGEDIFCQALRMNGQRDLAEQIEMERYRKLGGPRISLIHATRGRPEQAARARKIWLDCASQPDRIEHIFCVDKDDEASQCLTRFKSISLHPGGGCVEAWNHGAASAISPVLVQMSDDWLPFPKWDDAILERMGDVSQTKVLAVSDGHRTDNLLCMAIMTRAYLVAEGFMFHPWFKSMYSDNWFTHEAYRRGLVIEARDLKFTHHHPAFVPEVEMDATYQAQNAPERYAQGKALYDELCKGNDWSSVPGFFDYFQFYDRIAEFLKDGDSFVEVGVWLGRSIIYLAQRLKQMGKHGVKLYAVDTFKGEFNQPAHEAVVAQHGGNIRAAFEANLTRCGVRDMVAIVEGESTAAAFRFEDGYFSAIFIDAAHDYESVRDDILAWKPKLKPGGILSGHDAQWHEVIKAVKELLPDAKARGAIWMMK